ncbi:type IV secretion system protein VirD4 [Bradyrhizobium sp. USDA 4369]
MDAKLPSEKFAQRLAAIEQENAATRFIQMAENVFRHPTDIIRAGWSRKEGEFVFSRPVHEFTDYERFVFQLVMILGALGELPMDAAKNIAASVVHAGGKCKIDGTNLGDVGNYVAVHSLVNGGNVNYVPKPLASYATFISELIARQQKAPATPGLLKWLSTYVSPPPGSAAQTSALFSERGGPYALPLGTQSVTGRPLYYVGETSLLTVAPSGKGKTQCHILPTLARYKGPAIVLDIKGECFEHTAEWRRTNVGPVIRFNPVEPDLSSSYNPLAFVDDAPDELWESSRFLADLLVVQNNKTDTSWESQGRDLVTLLVAFVTAIHEPEERTMTRVLDLVATIGLEDMLMMVGAAESPFPSAMRRVAARMHQMMKNAPKQFEGVLSGASQHLQLWEGPKLERVTSTSDWKPEDFISAPFPTLYLCIPPNAVETYAPVLRVIIGQHVRRLMRSQSKAAAPILFLLDELPRLGRMAPIREALEVGRSYGIKLWMVAQYPEQLTAAYAEVGEGMMESCDVRMYMNPTAATAERLAKAFGKSRNVLDSSRKQLLEAADILGPEHRDSIFVLAANEQPQILRKNYYYSSRT